MRAPLFVVAFLGLISSTFAADQRISGHWSRGDGAARVRISPCGSAICAVNTWIKNPDGGEKVGDRLVLNVTPKSASVLSGTAYDPQRSLTYAIEIRVGAKSMTTHGCVLGGLLCKAVGWSRAKQ